MVLPPPQDAGAFRIPAVRVVRTPGVFDALLRARPQSSQPFGVARELPVAIELEHVAELPVRAGTFGGVVGPEREAETETHAARVVHVVDVVRLAHRAFESWKKERQRLLVIPDVGATPL